jgi:vacuolar-type H+-ATPase subunit E/Vma4
MSYLTESEVEAQRELLAEVIKSANDKLRRIRSSREERAKRFDALKAKAEAVQEQVDIFGGSS